MNTGGLILVVGSLLAATAAFIWLALKIGKPSSTTGGKPQIDLENTANQEVEHIFNDEFREELRNRGRLHFEKVIGENAMFLQQDLRSTTAQLDEYMKSEVTGTLEKEFKKYEQSIGDAQQIAMASIEKTITTLEQQRIYLEQQMQTQTQTQKTLLLKQFEEQMAKIINHYVLTAIGNQIDLSDQLDYILADLESNKQAIVEDIQRGA